MVRRNIMIKLDIIIKKQYNRETGELEVEEKEEFVCKQCRHLVEPTNKFCWFCGTVITEHTETEHYVLGRKLTDDQFKQVKGKRGSEINIFVASLPEEPRKTKERLDI